MYIPEHFAQSSAEHLHRLIERNPLGTFVTLGPQGLDANHLPFEFDASQGQHGVLLAHVARSNPVWQEAASGSEVLVVFRGAEGYISPKWYPSEHETHRLVPTWNYEVVHAHGVLTIRDDEKFVRGVIARLTRRHEAAEPKPWKMGDSPADYIDARVKEIVGLEVSVTRLVGKSKLSQNRETRDREGAAAVLGARGNTELSEAMRKAGS